MMRRVMASILCGMMAMGAVIPSASQAEPALDLIDACRSSPSTIDNAASRLQELGWQDVSSAESYTTFMLETLNQRARARLSGASFPERWTDATVARSYPSTQAASLADVQSDIDTYLASDDYSGQIILVYHDGDAIVVLTQWENSPFLECWLVGVAAKNPTLVGEFRSNPRRAQRGYTLSQWPIAAGLRGSITVLSDHALQEDPRFPVKFDLSLAFHVQKG